MIAFEDIAKAVLTVFETIFLMINGAIYNFINFLYQLFFAIANARLFTNENIQTIASRVYVLIGVIALFMAAYALLQVIINPDLKSGSEHSFGKVIPNIIKAILLLAFLPTIFNFAYGLQEAILADNVIPKIILGDEDFNPKEEEIKIGDALDSEKDVKFKHIGRKIANMAFMSFITPKNGATLDKIETVNCPMFGKVCADDTYTLKQAQEDVSSGKEDFAVYAAFASNIHEGKYTNGSFSYNGIFQLIAGAFICYVFISYCISIGLRAAKLAYFQLIAPIPVLSIILPGQKKIFDNWLKSIISTYIDVFVRIGALFLGIFMINMIPKLNSAWAGSYVENSDVIEGFAKVFLIIGILMFVKMIPKLLSEITGIQSGSLKLGIKDQLGEMAFIGKSTKGAIESVGRRVQGAATGALGAGWSAAVNNQDIKTGLKYGALNGFKNGGKQFNAQRQGIYTSAYDGAGKAGWFGKRAFFDKQTAQVSKDTKNAFKDENFRRVLDIQNSSEWRQLYDENFKARTDELNQAKKKAASEKININLQYDNKEKDLRDEIQKINVDEQRYTDLQTQYNNELKAFETKKARDKAYLEALYSSAAKRKDLSAQLSAQRKIDELEKTSYSNSELESELKMIKAGHDRLESLQNSLSQIEYQRNNDRRLSQLNSDIAKYNDEIRGLYNELIYLNRDDRTFKTESDFYKKNGFSTVLDITDANFKKGTDSLPANPEYKDYDDTHRKYLTEEEVSRYIASAEGQKAIAVREKVEKNIAKNVSSTSSAKKEDKKS